jgi:hypothetical protein
MSHGKGPDDVLPGAERGVLVKLLNVRVLICLQLLS